MEPTTHTQTVAAIIISLFRISIDDSWLSTLELLASQIQFEVRFYYPNQYWEDSLTARRMGVIGD